MPKRWFASVSAADASRCSSFANRLTILLIITDVNSVPARLGLCDLFGDEPIYFTEDRAELLLRC